MTSIAALPSIAHPHREQALKRARLTAGFPNIVDGRRLESSRRMHISDPVTGEELGSVTDTQKDGLDQTVQAAKAAFPLWSSKTWSERRDLLANAIEELKAHSEELCTILTAENGRPYSMAQWEIAWMLETYAPALLQMELPDVTWYEPSVGRITKRYVPLGVVAAISAWNLPFLLSFTKVLPSLLAGNTVVLKPAVYTPLTFDAAPIGLLSPSPSLLVERRDLEPISWQSHLLQDQLLHFFMKPAVIRFSLKDAAVAKIPVAPGQAVFCPRKEWHNIRWDETIRVLSIRMPDSALREAARERLTERSLEIAPSQVVTDDRLTHLLFALDAERARGYSSGRLFVDCIEAALANVLLTSFNTFAEIDSRQRGHGSSCLSTRC